ncbi:Hypothetical predicted protein [Paramuricea clavata]|uniref:Uncharacterized protein n=1 Tax=Paramuricea clavata TaxID=317549 RepID=A0A7D9D7W1_PARCT|nr:Hypothetical predicted protein [Paramuricea clavata]
MVVRRENVSIKSEYAVVDNRYVPFENYFHIGVGECSTDIHDVFLDVGIFVNGKQLYDSVRLYAQPYGKEREASYLECVQLPMVLPHLRIWLLCLHHDLPESEIKERGVFALGGRNRALEDDMAPYITLLKNFMKTKDYTLCVHLKAGRKICGYADALDRLPIDGV